MTSPKENEHQQTDNSETNDKSHKINEMRLDFAWKWFDFHAKQRMQLFNFFLIITGILATAFASSYEKNIYIMSFAVCLIGILQALGFIVFDIRSRELTRFAEDILEKFEYDFLFPDGFSHPQVNNGQQLGICRQDADNKMREGHKRGWKNIRKMKYWIRLIQIIVGLAFGIGLLITTIQLWTETVNMWGILHR